jgi:hypothetical protein
MTNVNEKIKIDFSNLTQLRELMVTYGDSESMFPARNSDNEMQSVSIYKDHIVLKTFQSNGWERENTYWYGGTTEETFNGRWK